MTDAEEFIKELPEGDTIFQVVLPDRGEKGYACKGYNTVMLIDHFEIRNISWWEKEWHPLEVMFYSRGERTFVSVRMSLTAWMKLTANLIAHWAKWKKEKPE